jgi:hypothetical protein
VRAQTGRGTRSGPRIDLLAGVLILSAVAGTGTGLPTAAGASAGRPSRVEFREIRVFPKHSFALGEPWSPTHDRLVLRGRDGLSVFDASNPKAGLRQVHNGVRVFEVSWSPDGDWLLLVIGDPDPIDSRTLVVVPWRGGSPDTLVSGVTFFPSTWGSDGRVAYVTGSDVHWIMPPHGSSPRRRGLRDAPSMVVSNRVRGRAGVQWVRPGRLKTEPLTTPLRGLHLLIVDAVPHLGRYLIQGVAADSPSVVILDTRGEIVADLGALGIPFDPSGLSADGALIVGYKTIEGVDDIKSSSMYVGSSSGSWWAQVGNVPSALKTRFSRVRNTIAYEELSGGVHVGVLKVEP